VLFVDRAPAQIAKETGWTAEKVESLVRSGLENLRAARAERTAPFVDRTVYASWNGMYASAYLDAWRYLGREDCRDFALRTLELLWREMWDPKAGMFHQWAGGARRVSGLLDDHVHVAAAMLDAHEATGEREWLRRAEAVMRSALDRFWDPKGGGFFDLAEDGGPGPMPPALAARRKPIEDSPSPSANGVAGLVLQRLHHLTGNDEYRLHHDELVRAFAGDGERMGAIFGGAYFLAAELWLHPPAEVVIVGPREDPAVRTLHRAAATTYSPGKTVLVAETGDVFVPPAVEPMIASRQAAAGPVAFVCKGTSCSPPTTDPEELRGLL
jgi:uncharacterized protein YyaL (SSP411 family)